MNIIVFDVDETLGAFSEFSEFCLQTFGTKRLTYNLFQYLLNNNPIYLQTNIIPILEYIKLHKDKNCRVVMFTNNTGHPSWIQYIKQYFHEKIKFELFDKVIYAKKYEPKRREESKSLIDFWNCTQYPDNSKVLFMDDQKHPYMLAPNVTYVHIPPYRTKTPHDISNSLLEFIDEFLNL
jgi:hypothetical protein